MFVTLLGTGTSHGVPVLGCHCGTCQSRDPRDVRSRTSAYLKVDGSYILIDTAPELRLQALSNNITRVDSVLLTHHHSDHICGFDDLRRFNELQGEIIPVYGNIDTIDQLKKMFSYIFNGLNEPGGGKPHIKPIPVDSAFNASGVSVTPIPVIHGNLDVLGYRIGNLAYITDCNEIPESSWKMLKGLEVLVLGVLRYRPHPTHFNLEQGLAMIEKIKPKRSILTHICHDLKYSEVQLPQDVELGYDGIQFEVRE